MDVFPPLRPLTTERLTKFQIFNQNHGLTLWKNANFVRFSNRCFHSPEMLVSCINCRKSLFHDLFSRSITWEYLGIPGVTWGYKALQRLQGVTGGYKGLQGVKKEYRGLQGDYKKLFF